MRSELNLLLKETSRSFYLTMRILPGAIRAQISLAYLLARATDTIADTKIVSVDQRLHALAALRERIAGTSSAPMDFGNLSQQQALPAEKILLERIEEALSALRQFSIEDQSRIREVLAVITSGQELDLRRFGAADATRIIALRTDDELDDYVYRVAGCVGEFWTKMCRAHLFPKTKLDETQLVENGVRFGKGLQLVNILRDLSRDLRDGRCYLPLDRLESHGLTPGDLLKMEAEPQFRPLYNDLIDLAHSHLRAGWEYTCSLPRSQIRLRLACAWPILIGVSTLDKLRTGNILDASQRVKISRKEVRRMIVNSVLSYPFSHRWMGMFPSRGRL